MSEPTSASMDVVDELTTDHNEVRALLAAVVTTSDPQARRDMVDTVTAELVRHSVAEEMYVYPAIRDHLPNGEEAVEDDTREHKAIEQMLKDLELVEASEPRFMELVARLRELVEQHASTEERTQFPALRAAVPREKLVELREKVDAAKKLAPTRPHPNAPNTELFHKLVGPGVGLVDRLRDKLSGRNPST
jgi:hemerythrin superfamily protein